MVKLVQRLFREEGIDLTLADEALGAIARKATTARWARRVSAIMEGIAVDTMFGLRASKASRRVGSPGEVVGGTPRPRRSIFYAACANAVGRD